MLYTIAIIKLRILYLNPLYFLIKKYYLQKIKVIGKENIPKNNGYMIISNHTFASEVFVVENIFGKINIIVSKFSNYTIYKYK